MKGGSIASIGVMENVSCDAFNAMENNLEYNASPATLLQGGKPVVKCRRIILVKRLKGNKMNGGVAACDVAQVDVLKPFTQLDIATLPLKAAAVNADATYMTDLPNATAVAIGQHLGGFDVMGNKVVFPTHFENATAI